MPSSVESITTWSSPASVSIRRSTMASAQARLAVWAKLARVAASPGGELRVAGPAEAEYADGPAALQEWQVQLVLDLAVTDEAGQPQ